MNEWRGLIKLFVAIGATISLGACVGGNSADTGGSSGSSASLSNTTTTQISSLTYPDLYIGLANGAVYRGSNVADINPHSSTILPGSAPLSPDGSRLGKIYSFENSSYVTSETGNVWQISSDNVMKAVGDLPSFTGHGKVIALAKLGESLYAIVRLPVVGNILVVYSGNTWSSINFGTANIAKPLSLAVTNNQLYLGTVNGLVWLQNNNGSWSQFGNLNLTGEPTAEVSFLTADGDRLFAVTSANMVWSSYQNNWGPLPYPRESQLAPNATRQFVVKNLHLYLLDYLDNLWTMSPATGGTWVKFTAFDSSYADYTLATLSISNDDTPYLAFESQVLKWNSSSWENFGFLESYSEGAGTAAIGISEANKQIYTSTYDLNKVNTSLLWSKSLESGSSVWQTNVGSLDGSPVTAMIQFGTDIYVGTKSGQVWRRNSDSSTWLKIGNAIPDFRLSAMALTDHPSLLFVAGSINNTSVIFKTADAVSWESLPVISQDNPQVNAIAIDAFGNLYATLANASYVYRYTNGDGIWSPVGQKLPNDQTTRLVTTDTTGKVLYVATESQSATESSSRGYVYHLNIESGLSTSTPWMQIGDKWIDAKITSIVTEGGYLCVAHKSGVSIIALDKPNGPWKSLSNIPLADGGITSLAIDSGMVFVGTGNGHVLRSNLPGAMWINTGFTSNVPITALQFRKSGPFKP